MPEVRKISRSLKMNTETTKNEEIEEVVKAVKTLKKKLAEAPELLDITLPMHQIALSERFVKLATILKESFLG